MSDNNFIDVDYSDYTKDDLECAIINGEPLFFSAMQVANFINEDVSTVRYWSKRFDKLLNIEISNKNRRQYKKIDIEKLRFIKKLAREDGLTLQQIEDYTKTKGFDIDSIEKSVMDSSNPLAIQMFISAMTVEIDKKFDLFLEKINEQRKADFVIQQEVNEKLTEMIAVTVDEIVTEKLDNSITEFKTYLDSKEQQAKQRDIELLDKLRKGMEDHKKQAELEQSNKKGFFSKLFKK